VAKFLLEMAAISTRAEFSQKPLSLQAAPRLSAFLIGPDYLQTMGIPLLRGRFFTPEDNTQSPCVAVIDSVFAQMYFKDSDPLNQTLDHTDPSRAEPASASYDEALPYVSVDYWVAAGFDRGIACALSDTAGRSAL
jgi:MacB-like periplasmic core domain